MNGFERCQQIERLGMAILYPFLRNISDEGRFVYTNKGPLSKFLQETLGDAVIQRSGRVYGVEFKIEESDLNDNFYLENWSNRDFDRAKPGWIYTLKTDLLLYYFIEQDRLYSIPYRKLWNWMFVEDRLSQYPQKPQGKTTQLNKTWGRCVPICVIEKEVGFNLYHPKKDFGCRTPNEAA